MSSHTSASKTSGAFIPCFEPYQVVAQNFTGEIVILEAGPEDFSVEFQVHAVLLQKLSGYFQDRYVDHQRSCIS